MTLISRDFAKRLVLIGAFLFAHLWLIWLGLHGIAHPMGDISGAYQNWVNQLDEHMPWFGLAQPWVYPYPDLLFIYGPSLLPGAYEGNWLVMAVGIDLIALGFLLGLRTETPSAVLRAGWLWTGLLVLIGPVGISRLDNISVAIAIIAVSLWYRNRIRVAAVVVALAVWVKVWPVAVLLGFLTDLRRMRPTLIWASGAGLLVFIFGALLGTPANVLSFISQQSSRGIQLEAPVATFWLWSNTPNSGLIYFDEPLVTFQIHGTLTDAVAALMGPIQLVALGITIVLAVIGAVRLRRTDEVSRQPELLAVTVLTATLDLIVFNKVGSPQYYGWLFVPGVIFVLWKLPRSVLPVSVIALLALLTQFVYPVVYSGILAGQPGATWVLITRNLLAIALLVYANGRLIQFSRSSRMSGPTLSRSIRNPS